MVKVPKKVKEYAPTLVFSKGEDYFPCDVFFAGKKVVENKQEYDKLNEQKKLGNISCYYHVNIGCDFLVIQYWYYYAHNPYEIFWFFKNNHEHDFECFKLFIGKKSKKPEYITCNIHNDRQITKIENGKMPEIQVELGGHGLYADTQRKPLYWKGEKDYEKTFKVKPLNSCENLRREVLKEPFGVMDKNFRLIGSDYNLIGENYAPTLPWPRWEYHFPEETLIGIHKMRLPVQSLTVDQSSVNFLEAIELGREEDAISPSQYSTFRSSFPELRAENEIEPLHSNIFFSSEKYGDILNEIGINSMKDVANLDPQKINLRLKSYIEENELKILIPSTRDIEVWQKEIIRLFGK